MVSRYISIQFAVNDLEYSFIHYFTCSAGKQGLIVFETSYKDISISNSFPKVATARTY